MRIEKKDIVTIFDFDIADDYDIYEQLALPYNHIKLKTRIMAGALMINGKQSAIIMRTLILNLSEN